MNISAEQLEFLKKEFGFQKPDIAKMSKEEWTAVREKCFMIEAEEVDEDTEEISERGELASSIADLTYKKLGLGKVA